MGVNACRFGISTHLFHGAQLRRETLLAVGAEGFETLELMATRSHFDYHNPAAVADLQQWLAEAGLTLHSVHAPLGESYGAGRWNQPLNLASSDKEARGRAVAEAEKALHIARRLPFHALIVHLGVPRAVAAPSDNTRDAARRSIEELHAVAEPLGVVLAVEVIANELSRAGPLVHFLEEVIEVTGPGICLDLGHAHLEGDVIDVIETVAEHLMTVELHDNRGRNDDHLVPFDGTIDWPGTITGLQKVGYDGALILELTARGSVKETLARAKKAREKLELLLAD